MKSESSNPTKLSRIHRHSKSRLPPTSTQTDDSPFSYTSSILPSNYPQQSTSKLAESHLSSSNLKSQDFDGNFLPPTEREFPELRSSERQIFDMSPTHNYNNKHKGSFQNDSVYSKMIKPIQGIRSSGTLDLSNISDRSSSSNISNFSNISRSNNSNINNISNSMTRDRTYKGVGKYNTPTFNIDSNKELLLMTSVPNLSALSASHNNFSIGGSQEQQHSFKSQHTSKKHELPHQNPHHKQPSITQQYMRSQINQFNPLSSTHTRPSHVQVCPKTEMIGVKKNENPFITRREPPDFEKPMEAPRSVLAEKSFNKGEMAHISHILRDQKYSKESKENVKPLNIGELRDKVQKENLHDLHNIILTSPNKATNKPKEKTPLTNKHAKDPFLQENYSPNFDESPIKINPIRTFKKFQLQESEKTGIEKITVAKSLLVYPGQFQANKEKFPHKDLTGKITHPLTNRDKDNKKEKLAPLEKLFPVDKAVKQSHQRRTERDLGEYLCNDAIFRSLVDFLCTKSLFHLPRVSRRFRSNEILSYIKKAQSRIISKGLSESEQYEFWDLYVNFSSLQKSYPLQFAINAWKPTVYERDILSDIDRTHLFNGTTAGKHDSLLRILHALSNSVPKIGYVQGMNTITSVFVGAKLKDSEVYWLMKYILNKKKFEEILMDGFPRVQMLNYQLDIYVRNYIPSLTEFLGSKDLNISYFSTQWFITMFSYDLEFALLIKIWNLFFVKGWKIMIKVALSLLWHFKDKICKQSSDELPDFLKTCVREYMHEVPEDELFKVAFSFKVSNRLLKGLETLYHQHSAPINVSLVADSDHHFTWKIMPKIAANPDSSSHKDMTEFLSENLDHLKNRNKMRGDASHEIDNYRCIQPELVVDKSLNLTRQSLKHQSHLIMSIELKPSSQQQLAAKVSNEKSPPTFLQTLSDFGKKLTQIWTPKEENLGGSSQVQADQNNGNRSGNDKGQQLPLSSRNSVNTSSSFLRKELKSTTIEVEDKNDSRNNSKRSLVNVLQTSTTEGSNFGSIQSIQPFSANLKEEEEASPEESKTNNVFDKVEKNIFCVTKREATNKHRKNTSLNHDMIRGFKKVLLEEDKIRYEASAAFEREDVESARLAEKIVERPKIMERQGQHWDVTGSRIKLPRETREIERYNLKRYTIQHTIAGGRYSHVPPKFNNEDGQI